MAQQDAMRLCVDSVLASKNGITLSDTLWRFHSGDDTSGAWAEFTFDDSRWKRTHGMQELKDISEKEWTGIGWYRLKVRVDSALHNVPLALWVSHRGASEVFIDGKRISGYGRVSAQKAGEQGYVPKMEFIPVTFMARVAENSSDTGSVFYHVIAVRYSDTQAWERFRRFFVQRTGVGFTMEIQTAASALTVINDARGAQQMMTFIVGALGTLAALHVLLFVFSRHTISRGREHLQYSLFTGGWAIYFIARAITESFSWSNVDLMLTIRQYHLYSLVFAFISCVAFFYTIFYGNSFPRRLIWVWAILPFVVFWMPAFVPALRGEYMFFVFVGIIFLEIMRIIVLAIKRKRQGAWILGTGGVLFVVLLGVEILSEQNVIPTFIDGSYMILISVLSIPVAMSLFLSRQVAQTNRDLETKLKEVESLTTQAIEHEVQQKLLAADNARKTQELEEARLLQLAMLPRVMPNVEGLDVAMVMHTATEVGGDYYDYFVEPDGTLTLIIGDATGHGVKAGTMVAATKSLVSVLAEDIDITSATGILTPCSPALKRMNMRGMFMALMAVKLRRDEASGEVRAVVANAGMPSALILRASGGVEEILIKSMPLGTMANFPYQERALTLYTGDMLVMMSDGFPERFNIHNEILGYDTVKAVCAEVQNTSAQQMIDHCTHAAERWAEGAPLNDDMTFIAVRVK
jgi:serine phosphatase RsbU (regulator of sigma subunit)